MVLFSKRRIEDAGGSKVIGTTDSWDSVHHAIEQHILEEQPNQNGRIYSKEFFDQFTRNTHTHDNQYAAAPTSGSIRPGRASTFVSNGTWASSNSPIMQGTTSTGMKYEYEWSNVSEWVTLEEYIQRMSCIPLFQSVDLLYDDSPNEISIRITSRDKSTMTEYAIDQSIAGYDKLLRTLRIKGAKKIIISFVRKEVIEYELP